MAFTVAAFLRVASPNTGTIFPSTISLKPQAILLAVSSISLALSLSIVWAYFQGGHTRAERCAGWRSVTGCGLIVLNVVGWALGGGFFLFSDKHMKQGSLWSATCYPSKNEKEINGVDMGILCRLQVRLRVWHGLKDI
jgi:hypothetical protein